MIGRRLVVTPKPGTRPGINRPRHERVSLERSPPDPLCGSPAKTRRTDSLLPQIYPIGLANRWKLNGKDFLIIVNGRAVDATVPVGWYRTRRRARLRVFGHIAA